jgi:hypothetical protein
MRQQQTVKIAKSMISFAHMNHRHRATLQVKPKGT